MYPEEHVESEFDEVVKFAYCRSTLDEEFETFRLVVCCVVIDALNVVRFASTLLEELLSLLELALMLLRAGVPPPPEPLPLPPPPNEAILALMALRAASMLEDEFDSRLEDV